MSDKQFFDYCRGLHKKTGGPNDKLIADYQIYMGSNASLRKSDTVSAQDLIEEARKARELDERQEALRHQRDN